MFLCHALLDGLFQCCHCAVFTGAVCVPVQGQYVFLYHALLDGLQTGHLAYPVSQYPVVYKKLCVDDEDATELKKQFQVI